ncbi:WD40 repeat-like protein [Pleurotus eryngii]|uniref:WD40 repeat-like protein n=1 Tax=Pleurotus eryngii TaxID=5323 RepID=A0A9P6D988_PLEER|nr:WD40 repeat-like protein [Pleurotus eryngii]
MDPALEWLASRPSEIRDSPLSSSSFHRFKYHYMTLQNWRHGGHLLREFSVPMGSNEREGGVITSVALDSEWIVVGSANSKIHVFSARTGVLHRVLVGHTSGVWSVGLVSRGGRPSRRRAVDGDGEAWESFLPALHREALGLDLDEGASDDDEETTSEPGGASEGWGQPNAIVVSAGCDQVIKVWEVEHGNCIHTLTGHTATIRSLKLLHRSPTAVTGARDRTVRVWDIQKGRMLRVLEGHEDRVRCVEVCGRRAVSGSYDGTCRMWDIDTGKCIHVLTGHRNQVYCVAFNGVYIASGGLDTVVRVWSAETGACLSILAGHTALVSQLQLSPVSREEMMRARNRSWDVTGPHFPSYTYTSPTSTSPPNFPSNSNPLSQSHPSPNPVLNLPSPRPILATGGSDGRVITYDIESRQVVHRIAAHDAAVMALQFDEYFIVTAGADGRVRVFETGSGRLVRDWHGNGASGGYGAVGGGYGYDVLSDVDTAAGMTNIPTPRYENVWKVVFGGSLWGATATGNGMTMGLDKGKGNVCGVPDGDDDGLGKREKVRGRDVCAVMCRKPGGRTVVEIWRMSPDMDVVEGQASDRGGEEES